MRSCCLPQIKQCLPSPQPTFALNYVLSLTSYGMEYNFGQLRSIVLSLDLLNHFLHPQLTHWQAIVSSRKGLDCPSAVQHYQNFSVLSVQIQKVALYSCSGSPGSAGEGRAKTLCYSIPSYIIAG